MGNSVHLIDPNTLQTAEISNNVYWRAPFSALASVSELGEFTVLDIEALGLTRGKYVLADVEIMRSYDSRVFRMRTHLGGILHPGDTAMGYLLDNSNFNDHNFEDINRSLIPSVILVKKYYPRNKKKTKSRAWKLRRLAAEQSDMSSRKQDQERAERDYEIFLRDIEEDKELRDSLTLYRSDLKNKGNIQVMEGIEAQDGIPKKAPSDADEDDEAMDDLPDIGLDELLDDFEELNVSGG